MKGLKKNPRKLKKKKEYSKKDSELPESRDHLTEGDNFPFTAAQNHSTTSGRSFLGYPVEIITITCMSCNNVMIYPQHLQPTTIGDQIAGRILPTRPSVTRGCCIHQSHPSLETQLVPSRPDHHIKRKDKCSKPLEGNSSDQQSVQSGSVAEPNMQALNLETRRNLRYGFFDRFLSYLFYIFDLVLVIICAPTNICYSIFQFLKVIWRSKNNILKTDSAKTLCTKCFALERVCDWHNKANEEIDIRKHSKILKGKEEKHHAVQKETYEIGGANIPIFGSRQQDIEKRKNKSSGSWPKQIQKIFTGSYNDAISFDQSYPSSSNTVVEVDKRGNVYESITKDATVVSLQRSKKEKPHCKDGKNVWQQHEDKPVKKKTVNVETQTTTIMVEASCQPEYMSNQAIEFERTRLKLSKDDKKLDEQKLLHKKDNDFKSKKQKYSISSIVETSQANPLAPLISPTPERGKVELLSPRRQITESRKEKEKCESTSLKHSSQTCGHMAESLSQTRYTSSMAVGIEETSRKLTHDKNQEKERLSHKKADNLKPGEEIYGLSSSVEESQLSPLSRLLYLTPGRGGLEIFTPPRSLIKSRKEKEKRESTFPLKHSTQNTRHMTVALTGSSNISRQAIGIEETSRKPTRDDKNQAEERFPHKKVDDLKPIEQRYGMSSSIEAGPASPFSRPLSQIAGRPFNLELPGESSSQRLPEHQSRRDDTESERIEVFPENYEWLSKSPFGERYNHLKRIKLRCELETIDSDTEADFSQLIKRKKRHTSKQSKQRPSEQRTIVIHQIGYGRKNVSPREKK